MNEPTPLRDTTVAIAGAAHDVGAVRRFELPRMRRVWYGPGCAAELRSELQALGCRRPILVTTPSTAARNGELRRLRRQLGASLAACFDEARTHVPTSVVIAAVLAARRAGADSVISVGGGSAIDCGKAVALCAPGEAAPAEQLARLAIRRAAPADFAIPGNASAPLPHVALPTTLSAAEYTSTFTVTNEQTGAKDMYHDERLTPAVVLLDCALTQATPAWLWASTGVRAIDHCVEFFLSRAHTPFTDALLQSALATLVAELEAGSEPPADPAARQRLQVAAWMSCYGTMNVLGGLSHAIGHQLGGHAGVPHGYTSCVVLPHVLEFNRPFAAERLAMLARAFGRTRGTTEERSAGFVADLRALIARLGLPGRLADVGVGPGALAAIARATMEEIGIVNNPRPVREGDVLAILRGAL